MILTKFGNEFGSLLAKETKQIRQKTFKQDDRETGSKSNGWQLIPQGGGLARTCVNKTMQPLRGGGVGRSPLDTWDYFGSSGISIWDHLGSPGIICGLLEAFEIIGKS